MALTDTRTIAIGVIIGLLVGGGIGYLIPQSKINELSMDNVSLEGMVTHLEGVNADLLSTLDDAEETVEDQKWYIDSLEARTIQLIEQRDAIEAEYNDFKEIHQEMWIDYNALIQDYNEISTTPVGQRIVSETSGVENGDFTDEEDWLKQGKGGIGWGAAYLHQYETFSTYLTQNIYLDSTNVGIKFDVKPEPLGGSIDLQVNIGDTMVYDNTFTGTNTEHDFETIIIPLKMLLKMREHYELPVEDYYSLKFTIPAGPESGALVIIDNVTLVNILYLPEHPLN